MEVVLLIVIGVCAVIIGAGVFLWRRNALAIDKAKAQAEAMDLMGDVKRDLSNWRDKLGK